MINKLLYSIIVAFLCIPTMFAQKIEKSNQKTNEIQRVRLDLTTSTGYVRQLLLGFTPDNAATDGLDYGYDAANIDDFQNDFGWIIENQYYVIQGVGEFGNQKIYPIGMLLENQGAISISLNALENFETSIDVFIYDTQTLQYFKFNEANFSIVLNTGEYTNRFFLTFRNDFPQSMWNELLSINQQNLNNVTINYIKNKNAIQIELLQSQNIKEVTCYTILGQETIKYRVNNTNKISVDTSLLKAGVYIFSIKTDSKVISKKLLIY